MIQRVYHVRLVSWDRDKRVYQVQEPRVMPSKRETFRGQEHLKKPDEVVQLRKKRKQQKYRRKQQAQVKFLRQISQRAQNQQFDTQPAKRKQRMRQKNNEKQVARYREKKTFQKYIQNPESHPEVHCALIIINLNFNKGILKKLDKPKENYSCFGLENLNRALSSSTVYFKVIKTKHDLNFCKVVGIKKNPFAQKEFVGFLDMEKALFRPIAHDLPYFKFESQFQLDPQKFYKALFLRWNQDASNPVCRITVSLGDRGDLQCESLALLTTYNIDPSDFPAECKKQLQVYTKKSDQRGQFIVDPQEISRREDLRQHVIFTIDPQTSRDFDDALSVQKLPNGAYKIGVHIADVSYFVKEGTLVDLQAQKRTTSTYLVHKVYPMLPRELCEVLCSLNPGVTRLALSVFIVMDEEGTTFEYYFAESVMKSCCRLSYECAQLIIDQKVKQPQQIQEKYRPLAHGKQVIQAVKIMHKLAQRMRTRRIQGGAVAIENIKMKFKLNAQNQPESFLPSQRIPSMFLVQEFMLLANVKAAQFTHQKLGAQALLRKHPLPRDKKIQHFTKVMTLAGHKVDVRNQKMVDIIDRVMKDNQLDPEIKRIVKNQTIFFMEQARYYVIKDSDPAQARHFALNLPLYTHFTSPIRRYPDVFVHRLIKQAIKDLAPSRLAVQQIDQLIERCNQMKINSKRVSQSSQKCFFSRTLLRAPILVEGYLTGFQSKSLRINVPQYGIQQLKDFSESRVKVTLENQQRQIKGEVIRMGLMKLRIGSKRLQLREFEWKTVQLSVKPSGWGLQIKMLLDGDFY